MKICQQKLKRYMELKGDKIKELSGLGIDFYWRDEAIECMENPEKIREILKIKIERG